MTRVKVCGLTRAVDAAHAERTGANYLGAILASGPRLLSAAQARLVLGPRRRGVERVAVFGAQSAEEISETARMLDLDVVQLHGDVTPLDVDLIRKRSGRTVWPVLRIEGTELPDHATSLAAAAGWIVLDANVVGQLGGTGVTLDWSGLAGAVQQLRTAVPGLQVILAGGLRPTNVEDAIRLLAPDVVDVSSGVETAPGVKDPAAVEQFVTAVHAAMGKGA